MTVLSDLIATATGYLKLALDGVTLKNSGQNLVVRNSGDTADSEITVSKVNVSGNDLVVNSDATNTGADRSITIARPTSGMSASYTLILPTSDGSALQLLRKNAANTGLEFATAPSAPVISGTGNFIYVPFSYSDTFPKLIFTTANANTRVITAQVFVTTAFNGTGTALTIGDTGNNSAVMAGDIVTPGLVKEYESNSGALYPTAGTNINLYLIGTGITQGEGIVVLEVYPSASFQPLLSTIASPVSFNDQSVHRYSTRTRVITSTTYTLVAADNGLQLVFNNSSAITVTVASGLYWLDLTGGEFEGFGCDIVQGGTGQVTLVGATTPSTVTLSQRENKLKLAGQNAIVSLRPTGVQNTYRLTGDLVA